MLFHFQQCYDNIVVEHIFDGGENENGKEYSEGVL